jgi:acyl transferase domain-containing protein/NAD(P)H-dependent flavin oxidoreductase YrpB (nitropropane dioxygenase family)/NAD(P)-dependent dehydrogenase (short-subunit alcohol dehydrogenase family)/acyl carrier protein
MLSSDIFVLAPAGWSEPGVAIAACRAGVKGTLDLEHATPAAVEKLARYAPAFGVRITSAADTTRLGGASPSWVILTADHPELKSLADRFRDAGAQVLVEAVSLSEAVRGAEAGADGVILKGHESGGRVGTDTSFILVQKWRRHGAALPFWVQGGVGPNTAAACHAAGARGVVLDSQVLLARESPLSEAHRRKVAGLDGGETAILGARLGEAYRCYSRADSAAFQELAREEDRIHAADLPPAEKLAAWRTAVRGGVGPDGLWLVGQDVAIAANLADAHVTVAGIVRAIVENSTKQLDASRRLKHLAEGSPLAASHGTKYPILQGPMTRVSDTAAFADAVAVGGGLPFLALALLRKAETEKLLAETKTALGKKPWGVGVLGFVPPEIRAEQFAAIKACKPPFAIIAGGRPDQAKELESQGIPTYLHVPSPGLLKMFLKDGARRFIFEGQECGGHVGPRASFALWESMTQVLLAHAGQGKCDDLHVVFAGGIHDGLSAGMVAALSAGLAEKGVKVGVLLGTAYLFTEEAVAGGAITAQFQKEALACGETVLLETGPGHAIRCIPTPYAETFETEKARLKAEGKSPLEVGIALERMNLGRLRVASKGVDRASAGANGTALAAVSDDDQRARGMYMIGQVAALRDKVTTVAELHADVAAGVLAVSPPLLVSPAPALPAPPPCDVAIIGMSCFYPKAGGLHEYWENILAKTNAVVEIPGSHWDWRPYYDPDPRAKDKMVSKWGGFMSDVVFEPLAYGITPKSIPNIEPLQLLLLEAVRQAIDDAGYANRPFERERAAAILGVGGGGMPLSVSYGFRACMPLLDSIPNVPIKSNQIVELGEGILPEWTEDSFPGILLNVAAGRVANRFNFGGPNMAIDAACGSSLAALYAGVRELNTGTSDIAVVMGADCVQTPYAYVAFSKTHALSPKGRCRPFDAAADGIALAEGIGVMVMKRLADAERDGDRIYAVVKGVGASSDGRDKGLTAPRAEGQLRALERAYAQARVSPARVGLVEAHGTGTVVGDQTEARALGQVFREAGGLAQSCALGSVKSMIGHSKCAAGLAGLIKASFALHHKMLPPTLAETPNPKANLDGGPLFLNTDARPWVHGADYPRTAGVSAFGFGGTNFHTVLEEYTGDYLDRPSAGFRKWPAELFVWRRADAAAIVKDVTACRDALNAGATPTLADLAASVWQTSKGGGGPLLAVVAASLDDLREKLDVFLTKPDLTADPRGLYSTACGFAASEAASGPPLVAFLFPGQGSQYPDMLAQTAMAFPEVRRSLDIAERTLLGELDRPLGKFIYPPSAFAPEQEAANRKELTRTEVAQPALGATSLGMFKLLAALGVEPDMLGGHSYGEYAALAAAGAMTEPELFTLSHRRGAVIKDAAAGAPGGMAAVDGPAGAVESHLKGVADVWVANHNSPSQTVIAGTDDGLKAATAKLQAAGLKAQRIPVACGFHTPLIAAAKTPLADALAQVKFVSPGKPVFSNTTTKPHGDASAIAAQLTDHLVSPVRFAGEVEAMYAAGARVFVECGPQGVLTGLTAQTLAGKPHLAVATDLKSRPGLVQLMHALGQLLAAGVRGDLDRLFQGRGVQTFAVATMTADTGKPKPSAMAWVVNGVRSRPVNGPEPRLLTQPPTLRGKGEQQPQSPGTIVPGRSGVGEKLTTVPPTPRAKMHPHDTPSANGHADHLPSFPRPFGEGAAQVMAKFQDVMAKFLDTQRSVMLGFLGRDPGLPAPSSNGHAAVHTNGNGNGHAAKPKPPAVTNRFAAVEPKPKPAPAPVVEVAPTPVVVEKPTAGPLDRDALMAKLLDLVSDRTGYPKEALSVDLDLEADLGIDSIKRVEVLGALAETIEASAGDARPNLEMEKLSVLKTLRGIADYVAGALADTATPKPADVAPKPADAPHPGARSGEVQRLVVELIDAPLPARPTFAPPAGTILITDDGRGTARELADRLAELDVGSALVRHSADADLTDPDAVAALLAEVKEKHGPIAGLIHLLPLAEPPDGETPSERARREVKSLYLLARGLEADIRGAANAGAAVLLAVTALGGTMGYGGDLPVEFFAGHGGVAGFTKCLGHEWPGVTVRAVDVDAETPAPRLAEQLLAELGDPDGPVEVGVNGRRTTWQCNPGPLDTGGGAAVELNADSTVLITGGARGITAKIARELASRHKCKLVLVGSSPEPVAENPDTTPLTTPAELKAALTKLLAADGKPNGPPAVEAAYRRLLKDREIRANLADIRAAGGTVEYHAIDVKDGTAFGSLIHDLNAKGGIDAVIHGAGVIEDKLLRDKTPESFDRVFGTKVDSAFTLAAKLDPARVKFFALFASITSRYGNRGQSDYAAANEVLSKLACDLDRRWPGRVVSVPCGPWAEVGMVAELEKHLVARGLKLLSPEQGATFAADELRFGRKGTPEVVFAGGTEAPTKTPRTAPETATAGAV